MSTSTIRAVIAGTPVHRSTSRRKAVRRAACITRAVLWQAAVPAGLLRLLGSQLVLAVPVLRQQQLLLLLLLLQQRQRPQLPRQRPLRPQLRQPQQRRQR